MNCIGRVTFKMSNDENSTTISNVRIMKNRCERIEHLLNEVLNKEINNDVIEELKSIKCDNIDCNFCVKEIINTVNLFLTV